MQPLFFLRRNPPCHYSRVLTVMGVGSRYQLVLTTIEFFCSHYKAVLCLSVFLFFISVTCCRMVIDESYESSDVGHGDDGGESDDDGEKIVNINASSKGCFLVMVIMPR